MTLDDTPKLKVRADSRDFLSLTLQVHKLFLRPGVLSTEGLLKKSALNLIGGHLVYTLTLRLLLCWFPTHHCMELAFWHSQIAHPGTHSHPIDTRAAFHGHEGGEGLISRIATT